MATFRRFTHKFGGINTVKDPASLSVLRDSKGNAVALAEMTDCVNIDVSDSYTGRRRPGYATVIAGSAHSLAQCHGHLYFVQAGQVVRYDGAATEVLATLRDADSRVCFLPVNGVVVASNGTDIGIIDSDGWHALATPTERYKIAMPAGRWLAFFNGRLYSLNGDVLTASDPYNLEVADERTCTIPLGCQGRFVAACRGGLWVGTERGVVFLAGSGPEDFTWQQPTDYPAIDCIPLATTAERLGLNSSGSVVLFATTQGLCIGTDAGELANISRKKVDWGSASEAAIGLRERNGQTHILVTLRDPASNGNVYTPKSITLV